MPSSRRTASPAVTSWITNNAGVPIRPGSAVTTPRTRTWLPTGRRRASPMDVKPSGDGVGEGLGLGVGEGAGVALGEGPGGMLG